MWEINPTNDRPDPATVTAVWENIDRALHSALLAFPREVLEWVAERTSTTSIVQDKASEVLDFINPELRAENDGTSIEEARANIARDVSFAQTTNKLLGL